MTWSLQILVIDDDDVDREQLRRLLATSDFEFQITEVSDSDSALKLVETRAFDCLILDCHLPGTNSVDFIKKLRRCGSPILMVSGDDNASVASRAMSLGTKGYLRKGDLSAKLLQDSIISATRIPVDEQVRRKA